MEKGERLPVSALETALALLKSSCTAILQRQSLDSFGSISIVNDVTLKGLHRVT